MSTPRYAFFPWLRHGLAAGVTAPDTPGRAHEQRVRLDLTVTVNDATDVPAAVRLVGPGDVLGIDRRAVVRTDPSPGATDFEPNFLPLLELYDEDMPWRYTPAAAGADARLVPWIALVVLAAGEFERDATPGLPAPAIRVLAPAASLPPPGQVWAWSHAQVNADLASAGAPHVREQLRGNPDSGLARLLCPRQLRPDTAYTAFVVPAFETGRLAGLGEPVPGDVDGLAPSWGDGQDRLPVYYEWSFRTGQRGDFEYLVRLLQPRALDSRIGTRDMDVTAPGAGLPPIVDPPALGLEGALRALESRSTEWSGDEEFKEALRALLDLPDDMLRAGTAGPDPLVAPPIYGCWPAGVQRIGSDEAPRWLGQLNLDPRTRAAAALGARAVRERQEQLVDAALEQLGAVVEANGRLRKAALAREVAVALFEKHVVRLNPDRMLALTRPLHARVPLGQGTVERAAARAPAAALLDPAFRRVARPRGPLVRRLGERGPAAAAGMLARVNAGALLLAAEPATTRATTVEGLAERISPRTPPGRVVGRVTGARGAIRAADTVRRLGVGTGVLQGFRPPPDFQVAPRGGDPDPAVPPAVARAESLRFAAAAAAIEAELDPHAPARPAERIDLPQAAAAVRAAIDPRASTVRRLAGRISVVDSPLVAHEEPLATIATAPRFPEPQYGALVAISPELLIPNLNLIPDNTVGLLRSNRPFIESFMVGLSHEMARELLWRDFVADQRATFFRQFWDVDDSAAGGAPPGTPEAAASEDVAAIAQWAADSELGDHAPPGRAVSGDDLVLVVRGQLLKRYPTAVIYAAEAVWNADRTQRALGERIQLPSFHAEVGADLRLLGFPLAVEAVRGDPDPAANRPGWFFVLKERPGDARFGLDVADGPATATARAWRELSWGHLAATAAELDALTFVDLDRPLHDVAVAGGPQWGRSSADQASILCQDPVLVAIHASEMLR